MNTEWLGACGLVVVSPPESFAAEDRALLDRVRRDGRLRLVGADADLGGFLAARQMNILGWEGPERVFLFPRASAAGSIRFSPPRPTTTTAPCLPTISICRSRAGG